MKKRNNLITYIPIIGAFAILNRMYDTESDYDKFPTFKEYKIQVIIQVLSFLSLAGLQYII